MNPDPDEHIPPGEEDLQWGSGVKEKNREKKPHSKYWAVSEQARKIIPGESQCKMFCGGKTCKYCTADSWTKQQMVVNGLYSEWVTDNILAMARMSSANIEKYKMIKQLQDLGVKTVVNLQQPGEHAYCGFGIEESGFSYNPPALMEAQLYFYNFAMEDYGVATMSMLLDIVKVMQFAVSLGKVAVHCHAGLGRTGLIIACYLIYNNRVKAYNAIQYVRSRRPGAIQTRQQMKACHEFEQYLKLFQVVFTSKAQPSLDLVSFSRFLSRQRHLLHGYEARKLKHIPKVVYICCERLLELCGKSKALSSLRCQHIEALPADLLSLSSSSRRDASPSNYSYFSDTALSSPLSERSHPSTRNMLSESISSSETRVLNGSEMNQKIGFIDDEKKNFSEGVSEDDNDDDDEDCIIYGGGVEAQEQMQEEARRAEKNGTGIVSDSLDVCASCQLLSVQEVCEAIVKIDMKSHYGKLDKLKEKLNKTDQAWQDLANEMDPGLICRLMCDWLSKELNEPVLRTQDVNILTEHANDPQKALKFLEKSTKHFLEYIVRVVLKLEPIPPELQLGVLEYFLCFLCQEKLNLGYFHPSLPQRDLRSMKADVVTRLFSFCSSLLENEKERTGQ